MGKEGMEVGGRQQEVSEPKRGRRWPFHLALGPAESPIKPCAVKTEQTAGTLPETDSLPLLLRPLIPT